MFEGNQAPLLVRHNLNLKRHVREDTELHLCSLTPSHTNTLPLSHTHAHILQTATWQPQLFSKCESQRIWNYSSACHISFRLYFTKAPGVLVTVASPKNDSLMDPPCHMLLLSLPSRGQLPSCEMSIGMPFSRPPFPDAYLFSHSSLRNNLRPTTACFLPPSLPDPTLFEPSEGTEAYFSPRVGGYI